MGLLTHYILDDRGKRVSLINLMAFQSRRYCNDDFTAKEFRRIRSSLPFRLKSFVMAMIVVIPLYIVVTRLMLGRQFVASSAALDSLVFMILSTVAYLLIAGLGRRIILYFDSDDYCCCFLVTRRCASCGYSLTDLTPEGDGCTVCPECGAAWRLNAESE